MKNKKIAIHPFLIINCWRGDMLAQLGPTGSNSHHPTQPNPMSKGFCFFLFIYLYIYKENNCMQSRPAHRDWEQALVIAYSVRLLPCQFLCRLIGHIGPLTTTFALTESLLPGLSIFTSMSFTLMLIHDLHLLLYFNTHLWLVFFAYYLLTV